MSQSNRRALDRDEEERERENAKLCFGCGHRQDAHEEFGPAKYPWVECAGGECTCSEFEEDFAMETCTCGHVEDEHSHDPDHPGSTACRIEGCDCVAFEASGDPPLVIE